MKDPDLIHKLLEAYYQGETSIQEEEQIREYFLSEDIPDELAAEAELFKFYNLERLANSNPGLEEKILREIDTGNPKTLNVFSRWKYYWISGAAAVILIMLAIFIDMQLLQKDPYMVRQDTFDDPYIAYAEASRVLHFVSEKMNTGTEPLKNLEKLNTGIDYVQPVFSFGPGIQMLEYLNTIDNTRKLISK